MHASFHASPHIVITVGPSTRPSTRVVDYGFRRGAAKINTVTETGRPVQLRRHTYLWHLWRGPNRPLSADAEEKLISELADLAAEETINVSDRADQDVRGDITTVLTALRCGLNVGMLSAAMPGVRPEDFVRTYRQLERHRDAGEKAWKEITKRPEIGTIERHFHSAARVLPTPTRELVAAASCSPGELRATARHLQGKVKEASFRAERVETVLKRGSHTPEELVEVGRLLYDPFTSCLWSDPYYLPSRVGAFTPQRLADLIKSDAYAF